LLEELLRFGRLLEIKPGVHAMGVEGGRQGRVRRGRGGLVQHLRALLHGCDRLGVLAADVQHLGQVGERVAPVVGGERRVGLRQDSRSRAVPTSRMRAASASPWGRFAAHANE